MPGVENRTARRATTVIACPSCGYEAADDFAFCPRCATSLVASRAAAEELKVVTTLFCDLVGFTAMSERADAESVDRILGEYFARATGIIESHGGVVEKFIGDAVVGVFGVPAVREDDPERAVRAGLRLIGALEGMTRPDGSPLQARCGVNTGEALVRLDVDPSSGRGFLTGDAVNTAARLQAAAPPMGVVVGRLTHKLTASAFTYEALAPLALKGKSRPVAAWLAREMDLASERLGATRAAPMVGREVELATCLQAVDRLRAGEGGLLLVTGEAGIGKTRLVEELRLHASEQSMSWLEGRTLSFGRSISYWPFLEIVQQDAGIDSDDGEAERRSKLTARLTGLLGDQTSEVLPYLATLLSVPLPVELAQKVTQLDGEAMGHQLYRASRLYFTRLAEERPLVLTFEDVHWLDASSTALLEHLLPLMDELPLLVCCVARPEPDTALTQIHQLARTAYTERATEIALQPLPPAQGETLVHNLVGLDDLPPGLRDLILAKAGGNPFFVEEIVRSLIDLGALVRDRSSNSYRVTERATAINLPDTLVGVIMARVDRLDEDLKQVLRLASVIGRSFFYRLLAAISEAERELDESLAGLQARELVLERARDPELEYVFKHALVQEATYESILKQRRRELHSKVARSIELLFADRLEDFSGLLAHHYTQAEDWEKAQEYLFKAGDQAGSIAADAEALEHYELAMAAYSQAFGDSWEPVQRANLERKIGEAFYRRGEPERAREHLLRALATLGHPFPGTPGAMRRALVGQLLRQVLHRLFRWFQPRQLPADAVRATEERCRAYHTLVWIGAFGDTQTAWLLAVLLCLNEGERAGLGWAASWGSSWIAMALHTVPSPRLFRAYIRRAGVLAEEGGWDSQLAEAAMVAGMYAFWIDGDFAAALRSLQHSASLHRGLGETRQWAMATGVAITVPAERGELAQALPVSREMTRLGVETGDCLTEVWGQAWEAELLYLAGDLAAGEAGMRRSVDALVEMMDFRVAAKVAGRLATCLMAQGRLEEAQALLDEHRERLRRFSIRGGMASSVITGLAAASLVAAEQSEETVRGASLKKARRACRAALKQVRVDTTAFVPAARSQGTYEWLRGRPHKAEKWWRRSLDHAEKLGARYEGAVTELEMGRRLGDPGALERAAAAFEDMGAEHCLAQTRALQRDVEMELSPVAL